MLICGIGDGHIHPKKKSSTKKMSINDRTGGHAEADIAGSAGDIVIGEFFPQAASSF